MSPAAPKNTEPDISAEGFDKHWHLSASEHEVALTEIEFAIFRTYAAFTRWMDDLTACCQDEAEPPCSGIDFSLLNVIRMHDRPKGISEIGRLLNRDDQSNLQYSMRKLARHGFIEKVGAKGNKKGATYRNTDKGIEATNRYTKFRRELLIPLTHSISDSEQRMGEVTNMLTLMSGIYDQAACLAATHRDVLVASEVSSREPQDVSGPANS